MKRFLVCLIALTGFGVLSASAAISVGLSGTGVWRFDTPPAVTEWATLALPGAFGDIANDVQLEAAVQLLSAATFTNALPASAVIPPSANALARFNTSGQFLQTRPTGVAATVLMATLRNDAGRARVRLNVSYDFRLAIPPSTSVAEEVFGLRAYFSLTGAPGSWQWIPQLSSGGLGRLSAQMELGSWPAGAPLFLLWADDNALANADNMDAEEGTYVIDDFSAMSEDEIHGDPISHFAIVRPISGESFPEGGTIPFEMFLVLGFGFPTNVVLYDGTNAIGRANPPYPDPLTFRYANAAPGLHEFTAVSINDGHLLTTTPVSITVFAHRPTLTLSSPPGVAQLSWPQYYTGFELQSASGLGAPVWERVTEPDSQYDGVHHVSVLISTETRFFRLEKR